MKEVDGEIIAFPQKSVSFDSTHIYLKIKLHILLFFFIVGVFERLVGVDCQNLNKKKDDDEDTNNDYIDDGLRRRRQSLL